MAFVHHIRKLRTQIQEYEHDLALTDDVGKQDAIRLELYFIYKEFNALFIKMDLVKCPVCGGNVEMTNIDEEAPQNG